MLNIFSCVFWPSICLLWRIVCLVKAANDLGYICYKWDVDTIDWMDKDNPDKIIERIKSKDIKDGSIVLMHPTKATTMCLDDIISIIRTRGYVPGKLSDVFNEQ